MAQKNAKNQNKRFTPAGLKALIATASVAATLAGWAILPSNDPSANASAPAAPQSISVPADTPSQGNGTDLTVPALPDAELPQVQIPQSPQGSSGGFLPFTSTHSSR